MKRKRQLMVFGVVVIVCVSSFLYWMCVLHPSIYAGSYSPPIAAFSYPTKENDTYTTRVICISRAVNPNDITWAVRNESHILASGDFPTVSGDTGSVTNNETTITWVDKDNDKKLSNNDTVKVSWFAGSLKDYTFKLWYKDGMYIGGVEFQE